MFMTAVTRRLLNYRLLFAVAAVAALTALLTALPRGLNSSTIALLYLLPVGLSTARWGLTAGVAGSLAAFLAFNYFFIAPYYTLAVHQAQDVLVLVIFLFVAIFVSQIVGRAQANLAATQAREHEALQIYELSLTLARLRTREQIAATLAERVHQVFRATATEVVIARENDQPEFQVREQPKPAAWPATPPHFVVPLLTGRGELGEVRVWRAAPPPTPADKRLLHTFASQGALALEHAQLEQAERRAQVLEETDRLKSALLSSVSHELRTPLASIQAAVTSLRGGAVDWAAPARTELLTMVDEEVVHLNRLVGNLLDMSRIEAGALKPERQWTLLADVVGATVARLRRTAEDHALRVDVPDDLPLIPVDEVQLDQVFTNLISNSLKYAPPGTAIHITARTQDAQTVVVQVRNQGPHVPETDLEHIFDKFYRVRAADRVTGTGLGLSICKGIVEAHGGRIWAENLPDGFGLSFTLPRLWDGSPPPALPAEAEA